jgi:urease accessory protein
VSKLQADFPDLDIIFIESGGDNLSATFSPELADITIYVIDVAMGQDIPRKRGPALMKSDILIINKSDLAPYVGVDLELAEQDAEYMRAGRPFFITQARNNINISEICSKLLHVAGLTPKEPIF